MPWNLDDEIEAENPVRFIHLFVKALDLKELGFVRAKAGPDGRVTCPIGRELFLYRERKYGKVYASREACRTCPNGKGHKTVKFGPETVYVPVIMYGRSRYRNVQQPNRYNAFGGVARAEVRVMGFIKRDVEKQKKRMQTSEHVFGTVKYWDQASYYLCRGKEKVGAETALMYLSYNIRRVISLAGA